MALRRCAGAGRRGGGASGSDIKVLLILSHLEGAAYTSQPRADGADRDAQSPRGLGLTQLFPADEDEHVLVGPRQLVEPLQEPDQPAISLKLVDDLILDGCWAWSASSNLVTARLRRRWVRR